MLRRIFGGLGRRHVPVELEAALPGAKEGGHGDHWGCVLRAIDEGKLVDYLVQITNKDDHPDTFSFGPGLALRGLAFRSEEGAVRTCVLVANSIIASAYPEVQGGPAWPITIKEIVPWTNGMEGQITGTCNGVAVSFFDTRFYANQGKYEVGQTYTFQMGALAYKVGHAPEIEAEAVSLGAKVSFKGAHAFMPAGTGAGDEGADIDDYWFHSPLEGEPSETTLADQRLTAYPIIIAIPDHFEMRVTLYAADHVLASDMALIKLGEDLQGFLWLHGYRE